MVVRNPDFIVCGAPRAGTTWLVEALEKHPEIFWAKPIVPEPKFFHIDSLYAKGMNYYCQTFFSDVPDGVVAGEKDTYYLENPDTPQRIFDNLPNVKLLFILREPGMRAWSNYLWSKMHGHETEDFLTALELEGDREKALPEELRFVRPHAYFSRGLYADQLQRYYDLFPKENLCCLNFNDLVQCPDAFLAQAQDFLDVALHPEHAQDLGNVNMAKGEMEQMPEAAREWLDQHYETPNAKLHALLGTSFKMWNEAL